ncbi:MAG: septal ring lytic transglycosylase RlpA family protein [Candidatus Omnitrophota bacterium]
MKKSIKRITFILTFAFALGLFPRAMEPKLTAMPSPKYTRLGKASWYSKKSPGINRHTANNEIFDDTDLTCAMWGVPFNQRIRVTNLSNGKSIIVRVNDRGPHKRFVRQGRIIDLTRAAFSLIESPKSGLTNVEIEFL